MAGRRLHHGPRHHLDDAVYKELRQVAERLLGAARANHTLQPTAVVHEAFLKLAHQDGWNDQEHFRAVAARAVRQVLVDYARHGNRLKRGGKARRISLDTTMIRVASQSTDVLELHEALVELEREDPRAARVVELRFFGDLPMSSIAQRLDTSLRTVERDWRFARAWLVGQLSPSDAQ